MNKVWRGIGRCPVFVKGEKMARQSSIEKLRKDLELSLQKRNELDVKIKDLEEKILELKRQEIIGIVEQAELTPQELATVIQNAKNGVLGVIPGKEKKGED